MKLSYREEHGQTFSLPYFSSSFFIVKKISRLLLKGLHVVIPFEVLQFKPVLHYTT